MGIRLIVEVLEHAPDDLTWRERHALTVLAENANDGTRECWPGIEEDEAIAHRMRLPGRSSRYEVMKALRAKKAIETVSAGRRGHRAVYRITELAPAKGPGTTDPNDEAGSGEPGHGVRETWTQSAPEGPENPDPNSEKGSGNDPERVREPHGKGPGTTDPFPSDPSTPQGVTTSSAGRGESAATGPRGRSTPPPPDHRMDKFTEAWLAYPRSLQPEKSKQAWRAAIERGADAQRIVEAAIAYAYSRQGEDPNYTPYFATWLNAGSYDDPIEPKPSGKPKLHAVKGSSHRPFEPPPASEYQKKGFAK